MKPSYSLALPVVCGALCLMAVAPAAFAQDYEAPRISIYSPENGSVFARPTRVEGRTRDDWSGVAGIYKMLARTNLAGQATAFFNWRYGRWISPSAVGAYSQDDFISWADGESRSDGSVKWWVDLPPLADGIYAVEMLAKDYAGRRAVPQDVFFGVDTQAPRIAITTPVHLQLAPSSVVASGAMADVGFGVASQYLILGKLDAANKVSGYYDWEDNAWRSSIDSTDQIHPVPGNVNSWKSALPRLNTGTYFLTAWAVDYAGNMQGNVSVFAMDKTGPQVVIDAPLLKSLAKTAPALIGRAADQFGVAGVAATLASVDAQGKVKTRYNWKKRAWTNTGQNAEFLQATTLQSGKFSLALPTLADGLYATGAAAWDNAANVTPAVSCFGIDSKSPTNAISAPAAGRTFTAAPKVTGTAKDAGFGVYATFVALAPINAKGEATSYYNWKTKKWIAVATATKTSDVFLQATGTTSWSAALPTLAKGSYGVWVWTGDLAGNISLPTARAFAIAPASTTRALNGDEASSLGETETPSEVEVPELSSVRSDASRGEMILSLRRFASPAALDYLRHNGILINGVRVLPESVSVEGGSVKARFAPGTFAGEDHVQIPAATPKIPFDSAGMMTKDYYSLGFSWPGGIFGGYGDSSWFAPPSVYNAINSPTYGVSPFLLQNIFGSGSDKSYQYTPQFTQGFMNNFDMGLGGAFNQVLGGLSLVGLGLGTRSIRSLNVSTPAPAWVKAAKGKHISQADFDTLVAADRAEAHANRKAKP